MGSSLDQKQTMALKVLTKVLFEGDNAPLRLALLRAGLGSDVSGSLNASQLQPVLSPELTNHVNLFQQYDRILTFYPLP